MAFKEEPRPYSRGIPPVQASSQVMYLQEELKKLEISNNSLRNALLELDARLKAANIP